MTIEELLELPVDDISKLTDSQLEAHLTAYLPLTRPADLSPPIGDDADMDPELAARLAELRKASKPSILNSLKK